MSISSQETNARNSRVRGSQHVVIGNNRQDDRDFEAYGDAGAPPANQTIDRPSTPLGPDNHHPASTSGTIEGDSKSFRPVKNLARRMLKSIQAFLALIFAISIFGAQTFNSLVGQLGQPNIFSEPTVRTFMAISWLMFTISLAVSVFAAILIDPYVTEIGIANIETANSRVTKRDEVYRLCTIGVVATAELLLLIGFVFMCLVVMAYAKALGIVGLCMCGLTGFAFIGGWIVKIRRPCQLQDRLPIEMV